MLWHMHLMANIEHLATRDGIICVLLQAYDIATSSFRFNPDLKLKSTPFAGNNLRAGCDLEASAEHCIKLFAAAGEPPLLRIVFADYTIIVERHGETRAAVVMIAGHSVAKSVHRLIRRLDKSPKKAPSAAAEATA